MVENCNRRHCRIKQALTVNTVLKVATTLHLEMADICERSSLDFKSLNREKGRLSQEKEEVVVVEAVQEKDTHFTDNTMPRGLAVDELLC